MPTFSSRLRKERERLGLSQQEFAEKCGVTMRSQRNYEKGPRMPDAGYLAAAEKIGVNLQYLIVGMEFQNRLNKLSEITSKVVSLDLPEQETRTLHDILSALETENVEWLKQYLSRPLSKEELELIKNYRASSPRVQTLILHMSRNLLPDDIHKFKSPKKDD